MRRVRVALWVAGLVELDGVVAILVQPRPARFGLAAVVVVVSMLYLLRLNRILRGQDRWLQSARVALMAPLLPCERAVDWLQHMNNVMFELRAAGRPSCARHTVVHFPSLAAVAWWAVVARRLGIVRSRIAFRLIRRLAPRVRSMADALHTSPPWPEEAHQTRAVVRRWRQVRRWSWLLTRVVRRREHPELVTRARWLLRLSTELLDSHRRELARLHTLHLDRPAVARILEINGTITPLAELLTEIVAGRS